MSPHYSSSVSLFLLFSSKKVTSSLDNGIVSADCVTLTFGKGISKNALCMLVWQNHVCTAWGMFIMCFAPQAWVGATHVFQIMCVELVSRGVSGAASDQVSGT